MWIISQDRFHLYKVNGLEYNGSGIIECICKDKKYDVGYYSEDQAKLVLEAFYSHLNDNSNLVFAMPLEKDFEEENKGVQQ